MGGNDFTTTGGQGGEKKSVVEPLSLGLGRRRTWRDRAPLINNANTSTLSRRQIARSAGVPWAYVYASCCPRSDEEKKMQIAIRADHRVTDCVSLFLLDVSLKSLPPPSVQVVVDYQLCSCACTLANGTRKLGRRVSVFRYSG